MPLPARYGFWPVPGGVAVEVVTRHRTVPSAADRGRPASSAACRCAGSTCERRDELPRPLPLRCDLKETSFAKPARRPPAARRQPGVSDDPRLHRGRRRRRPAARLSWAYFRRYPVARPPIGVFNLRDVVVLLAAIALIPYLYLELPVAVVAACYV